MSTNLGKHLVNNVFWSCIDKFSVQFVQLITTIIIARIVSPSEFGLVAMVTVFLSLAQILVDSGFCTALIQRQDCNNNDYSTVFYFNLIFSVFIYGILYLLAPIISSFYREPQLVILTRFVGINIIISALSYVQRTILIITMKLKLQAKISFISITMGAGVGITLAYQGYGVWALIMQTLITNISDSILLWSWSIWKPTIFFSEKSFKKLFPFGSKILISSLIQTLYANLYTIVVGKVYSAINVGYFNRVQTILNLLSSNIMNIIDRPIYAFQCKYQGDPAKTKKFFIIYLRFATFVIFPIMLGGYILAEPLIVSLLTQKWLSAVPIFQILSIAALFVPISIVNTNILKVLGLSKIFLKTEIVKKILGLLILFISVNWGVLVVCYGLVLYNFLDFVVSIFVTQQMVKISWRMQLLNILPNALLSGFMCVCIYCVTMPISSLLLKLFAGIFVGIFVYVLLAVVFKFREIEYIKSYLKS